ncbi:uncharacterized protein LOC143888865 [Tasmannia lanceolata]|uniref:uncharacterized protein LOC143888865 n=1 Tax=Tasmannia lanceolata TaxID=3420 RepID=UPI0040631541
MFRYLCRKLLHFSSKDSRTHDYFLQNQCLKSISHISNTNIQQSFTVSYLINSCGLSKAAALSAATKIRLKTTKKADSALIFFQNHGFTKSHIINLITKCPSLLLANPDKTLKPKFELFTSLGFSSIDLAELLILYPTLLKRSLNDRIIPSVNFLKSREFDRDGWHVKCFRKWLAGSGEFDRDGYGQNKAATGISPLTTNRQEIARLTSHLLQQRERERMDLNMLIQLIFSLTINFTANLSSLMEKFKSTENRPLKTLVYALVLIFLFVVTAVCSYKATHLTDRWFLMILLLSISYLLSILLYGESGVWISIVSYIPCVLPAFAILGWRISTTQAEGLLVWVYQAMLRVFSVILTSGAIPVVALFWPLVWVYGAMLRIWSSAFSPTTPGQQSSSALDVLTNSVEFTTPGQPSSEALDVPNIFVELTTPVSMYLILTVRRSTYILQYNVEKVMAPKIAVLQNHGVPNSMISKLISTQPRTVIRNDSRIREMVAMVKEMGFNPVKANFIQAVCVMSGMSKLNWEGKLEVYRSLGWSEAAMFSAFKLYPNYMVILEKKIRRGMDFFVNKMNCKPSVISKYPNILALSLEKRIVPRCSVLQVLMSKGLIKKDLCLAPVLKLNEKEFLEKFVIKNLDRFKKKKESD